MVCDAQSQSWLTEGRKQAPGAAAVTHPSQKPDFIDLGSTSEPAGETWDEKHLDGP